MNNYSSNPLASIAHLPDSKADPSPMDPLQAKFIGDYQEAMATLDNVPTMWGCAFSLERGLKVEVLNADESVRFVGITVDTIMGALAIVELFKRGPQEIQLARCLHLVPLTTFHVRILGYGSRREREAAYGWRISPSRRHEGERDRTAEEELTETEALLDREEPSNA